MKKLNIIGKCLERAINSLYIGYKGLSFYNKDNFDMSKSNFKGKYLD